MIETGNFSVCVVGNGDGSWTFRIETGPSHICSSDCDSNAADLKASISKTSTVTNARNSSKQPKPSAREVLALNLIRQRGLRGWSQEALAFEAGLHRTFVAHVERQARNISLDNLERLALALELRPYQLLEE